MKTPLLVLAGVTLLAGVGLAPGPSRATQKRDAALETRRVIVPAQANIFGAGRGTPPDPGGGGGGVLPPSVPLSGGGGRIVTFPKVVGRVNPISWTDDWNGPAGDRVGPTDVVSYRGISGLVHKRNGMFLAGVFLTDTRPSGPAPPRLDFTGREGFSVLAPRIAQTFLIGSGKGHAFRAPPGATRLLLGFADGFLYQGLPGWYDNNAGGLRATVRVEEG